MPKYSGVYCIENTVNSKVYVGSAIHIERRWREHERKLDRGTHHNRHLQAAWTKYGSFNFRFYVLEYCRKSKCVDRETHWIEIYLASNQDYGYNVCHSGCSRLGVAHSKKARRAMSKAKKGKQPRLGAVLSDETKAKISAANKGRKMGAAERKMRGLSQLGRRHTEESLELMRKSHWSKGPRAKEIAAKIAAGLKGHPVPQEVRDKISQTKLQAHSNPL